MDPGYIIPFQEYGLAAGQTVVAGVSGGADSLTLMHLLARSGLQVVVAHFDHRLRPTSSQDADFVRACARHLGLAFELGGGPVAQKARRERQSIE
ncbi:MAG: ATP-binding protein, partial [Anaerolineaceae bacterium]|nr:ATP-binding protein [Anaerolineaceae bacterium]